MISTNTKVGQLIWFAGELWWLDGTFGKYSGQTLFAEPQMALLVELDPTCQYAVMLMFPTIGKEKESLACTFINEPVCKIWKVDYSEN
jgi:hypothetical protein